MTCSSSARAAAGRVTLCAVELSHPPHRGSRSLHVCWSGAHAVTRRVFVCQAPPDVDRLPALWRWAIASLHFACAFCCSGGAKTRCEGTLSVKAAGTASAGNWVMLATRGALRTWPASLCSGGNNSRHSDGIAAYTGHVATAGVSRHNLRVRSSANFTLEAPASEALDSSAPAPLFVLGSTNTARLTHPVYTDCMYDFGPYAEVCGQGRGVRESSVDAQAFGTSCLCVHRTIARAFRRTCAYALTCADRQISRSVLVVPTSVPPTVSLLFQHALPLTSCKPFTVPLTSATPTFSSSFLHKRNSFSLFGVFGCVESTSYPHRKRCPAVSAGPFRRLPSNRR